MPLTARFPIVVEHSEAVGVCEGQSVRASLIPATAAILLARGASEMIVPAPGQYERESIERGIARLPAERRGLVRIIDADSDTLKRVRAYLEPLRQQASKWPEDAFVSFCETFIYQLANAARNKAGILNNAVDVVRGFVPIIDPTSFHGEARFRLAELVSVICAYSPVVSDQGTLQAEISNFGATAGIWEILDSTEFRAVVAAQGKLGYLANPRVGLRRVAYLLKSLAAHPSAKHLLKVAKTAAEVAGVEKAGKGLAGLAEIVGEPSIEFWPPFIELGPAALPVYQIALTEAYPQALAPPGTIMAIEYVRFGKKGMSWLNTGEEAKLEQEAQDGAGHRKRNALAARAAQQRFLTTR